MARKSSKPSMIENDGIDTDGLHPVKIIEGTPDVAFRDPLLAELRATQEAFADPSELMKSDGVYLVYDPAKHLKESSQIAPFIKARLSEKIVFDPRVNAVPIGTGDEFAKYAMENRTWGSGDAGNTVVSLGSVNITQAQRQACGLFASHPLAKNIIRNLTTLTIGEGPTVNFTGSDARRSGEGLKKAWARWEKQSRFQPFIRDVVRTAYICGEVFVLWREDAKGFELIEPDRVDRIFYDTTSARRVAGYRVQQGYGLPPVYISADNLWHLKFDQLGNVPRGIPRLLPVFVPLRYWSLFMENRHWINMVRARIPLVRTVKGSNVQIQREKSRTSTLPPPGTLQFDPSDSEWKFPTHNVGASDVVDDRKLIESAIAAGVSMPIMLVTGDLSANYSSGVLQESPLVRDIEDSRDMIREMIEWMVEQVMNRDDGFSIQFAPVVKRNFADIAAAAGALVDREIWSRRTAAEATGRSWADIDGERERLMAEELDGFVNDPPVDPFNKQADGGVGAPTKGTSMGGSSNTKSNGGDGE